MKTIWGICALNHDASISVVRGDQILFAGHSERYSRVKNDPHLNVELIEAAASFGNPDEIIWFEKPISKKVRQAFAGQWGEVFSKTPKSYLASVGLGEIPVSFVPHHESHAAAGYFTSKFDNAAIIVIDAIGEWDTISVWHAQGNGLRKIWSEEYPNSLGMLYSAMTQRVGLKPNEEEYIMMGMAAYGNPSIYYNAINDDLIEHCPSPGFKLKQDVHRGIKDWRPDIKSQSEFLNLAASIQSITQDYLVSLAKWVRGNINSSNLVIMGGVALNCVANEKIARMNIFNNIWIMPNPGDAGSSLGCILAKEKLRIDWQGPYLGTNIDRPFDTDTVVDAIISDKIIGIATGRAEFGPRSLGNRSLIADPRGNSIKSQVNNIKKRQQFRPFAPIVLAEYATQYFDMPLATSPYMQFTSKCLRPDLFPAICHIDGSSRVQTLTQEQNPRIYKVLQEFYARTGCPILLNTSLNIKGEPLVDDWEDALEFQRLHNIKIF
jgi:carbamoyltransferase